VIDMAKPRRSQSRQGADSFLTPFIPSAIGAEFVRPARPTGGALVTDDARTGRQGVLVNWSWRPLRPASRQVLIRRESAAPGRGA